MSSQQDWEVLHKLRRRFPEFWEPGICIDGGSRDMNGSVSYFLGPHVQYIGIDKCGDYDETYPDIPIAGVSWHGYVHEYPGEEVADLVTCFNAFEHDPYWKKSVTRLVELLKPGGLFVFQLVLSGPEHGDSYSVEGHYENMSLESVRVLLNGLPVKIIQDIFKQRGYKEACPVDSKGKILKAASLTQSTRDIAYLIGRKNGQ